MCENVQSQGQHAETPTALHWPQTITATKTTITTCTTANIHHRSSIHVNGRCSETLQYLCAGDIAPRPPITHPPPPTINEDIPRQTPCIQISGCHHNCLSQSLLQSGVAGRSRSRLLPRAKDQISRGPTLSFHQYPETTDSTVCSIC